MKQRLLALSILLATTRISWALSAATEIVISVPDQQLAAIDRGKLISKYAISTSKFGLANGNGTYRTPLGILFVSAKFGDHLPAGAVIKNRVPTGEVVNVNAPGRDAIVSRVIWLREWNNRTVARAIVAFTFTARQRNAGLELPRASAVSGCAHVT
jgi:hypothetical protein